MFKDERRTLCGYWRKSVAASDSRHLDSFKQRASGSSRTIEAGGRSACTGRTWEHSKSARRLQFVHLCHDATYAATVGQAHIENPCVMLLGTTPGRVEVAIRCSAATLGGIRA